MLLELPQRAASLHIRRVILWDTGQVLVIDRDGKQIPELQGHVEVVGRRINDIYKGVWMTGNWTTGEFQLSSYVAISQIRVWSCLFPQPALDEQGFIKQRRLADGRLVAVDPLLSGRARLGIGPSPSSKGGGFSNHWEYPNVEAALQALEEWNPEGTPEPDGWDRHRASGRCRIGGQRDLEYVKGEGEPVGQVRDALYATKGKDRQILEVAEETDTRGELLDAKLDPLRLPAGTRCFMVCSESSLCRHNPKCQGFEKVFFYLDRCVVLSFLDLIRLNAENIQRRLTEK